MFKGMRRTIGLWTLMASALLVTGCAQNVRSTVTVFQRLDSAPPVAEARRTYTIAKSAEQTKSLELSQYEDMLVAELGPLGFSAPKTGESPRYRVEFDVRSSDQRTTYTDYTYPRVGIGFSRGYYPYGGRFVGDPFFATPIPVQRSYEFTRHELMVRIFDSELKDPKAVWEGRAVTDSASDTLGEALPYLMRSVFAGFPGDNGKTRTVTIPRAQNR